MKRKPWIIAAAIMLCLFMALGLIGCGASQEDIDAAVDEATKPYLQQIADLEAEKAALEEEKADLERQNGELEEYIDELEAEIEELTVRINCLSGKHVADLDYNSTFVWADDYSTCTATGFCVNCEEEFTETADKSYDSGLAVAIFSCGLESEPLNNVIDATSLADSRVSALLSRALAEGNSDIHITLAADADENMIVSIRNAILGASGFADGGLNLTLAGVESIPAREADYSVVRGLGRISLPDAVTIGDYAFHYCEYLRVIDAPKAQVIGECAFTNTAVESIELPEARTIGVDAFSRCESLTLVKLPKATRIEYDAFYRTALSTLILLAEDDIVMGELDNPVSEKVDLVLDVSKQDEVDVREWSGYTFKRISFACLDGTTNHTYENATNNSNDTHTFDCSACDETVTECCYGGEATCTKRAECEACGAEHGELAKHVVDSETGYCQNECGTFAAAVSVTVGESVTYYQTLEDIAYESQEGATVTLLKSDVNADEDDEFLQISASLSWGSVRYTLNLNGFDLGTEDYVICNVYVTGTNVEASIVNTSDNRAGIRDVTCEYEASKLTVGEGVDIENILVLGPATIIDLTAADFESMELYIYEAGFDTANIIGNYGVYDENGNRVTGVLSMYAVYEIRALD